MNDAQFRRRARHLLVAWAALILLMLASLGSAYIPLGTANGLIGAGIAMLKSAIVVSLFMGLWSAGALLRIVAATALATWCILLALGGLDTTQRPRLPAPAQDPQQVAPHLQEAR
ncbi:oxidase [Ramlibacter sp. USB13]|uniref:Oxidase n=1 Tax=Ramlibacter cellulosilyticus TaxID=2764187 RepID=A0A923SBP4_9BURK|nr:oxidase [Ramlibacter cellulosilyticus]MBC5784059.1 oxidase [Ramlibacter cellulosilyticus]